MKTIKIACALVVAFSIFSCVENEAKRDAIVQETLNDVVPKISDTRFEQALNAYENGDKQETVIKINEGIDALRAEGENVSGLYKVNLDAAEDRLRNIAAKIEGNTAVSIEGFKEAIANAEINIAHNYLASDEAYVLTSKERLKENNLHKALNHNLKSLENVNPKLKGTAQKEGQILSVEAKKLKEDYEAWKIRADQHAKKSEEYFKKHEPNDVYIW